MIALIVGLDQAIDVLLLRRFTAPVMDMIEFTDSGSPPYFGLRPGAKVLYTGMVGARVVTHVNINSLGMRDRERPIEKPPGIHRVVAIGDSNTFGLGVEMEDTMPAQLERAFHEAGRNDIEVWNAGTPAYSLADYLGTLRIKVLPLRPDLVLLQLTGDDAIRPFPVAPALVRWMHFSGLAKVYFAARLWSSEDLGSFQTNYAALVDECERAKVPVALWIESAPPGSQEFLERFNREHGVRMLSVQHLPIPRLENDAHFTPDGNRQCSKLLFDMIHDLL